MNEKTMKAFAKDLAKAKTTLEIDVFTLQLNMMQNLVDRKYMEIDLADAEADIKKEKEKEKEGK